MDALTARVAELETYPKPETLGEGKGPLAALRSAFEPARLLSAEPFESA
jgi:hypothetical protein